MQGDDRLVELIEWHFAALVSGNNMPHMSGDPRARLHPGQRRRLNDAARAALASLRQHRPDVAAVLDGEAVAVPRTATWEMIDAARDAGDSEASWGGIYDAFLSRSPYAPPPECAP